MTRAVLSDQLRFFDGKLQVRFERYETNEEHAERVALLKGVGATIPNEGSLWLVEGWQDVPSFSTKGEALSKLFGEEKLKPFSESEEPDSHEEQCYEFRQILEQKLSEIPDDCATHEKLQDLIAALDIYTGYYEHEASVHDKGED